MDDIKSKIEAIELNIKTLQIELNAIRSICKHPKDHIIIKDVNPSGISKFKKVCGICGQPIGWPSSDEMSEWTS